MPLVSTVKCPTCEHGVAWTQQSRWRPFCSERCKLIDLGAWATDQYKIAGREHESHPHESAQTDERDPLNRL